MQLLEYQAKELLRDAGLPVPANFLCTQLSDLEQDQLDYPLVLKSQVPVGGRGKAGGIKRVESVAEAQEAYSAIINTAIKGHTPESVLAEEAVDTDRELYLALRVNRDERRIEWLVSDRGGIDIEDNATSVKIIPQSRKDAYETISYTLGLKTQRLREILEQLETCFTDNDLLLLEINPLIVTKTDTIVCADAKVITDDNAAFRHPAYVSKHVTSSIIPLGGPIGVIANGAGMAMSTMDTIYAAGGRPANFLDIGGGTGEDVFVRNLRDITALPGVTSIIINIFAGITHCDDIARGIITAKQHIPDLPPLFIRLEGTNRDEAAELLEAANISIEQDLASCVRKAIGISGTSPTLASITESSNHAAVLTPHYPTPPAYSEQSALSALDILFSSPAVIVQGITGHHGSFHTRAMLAAGTHIVAGVTPGKSGENVEGIPVYNTVAEAVSDHPATTSVTFVPARFARTAMLEAIDAGIRLIVCITEGIPVHDMLVVKTKADEKNATIIGPNCPGFIIPGSHKLGIIAAKITSPGTTAIISRSGTLTYELAYALTQKNIGQSIVLGIGGDPVQGMNFQEALEICEHNPDIDRIVMIGEIGGTLEQSAADYAKDHVTKPVYGLVVGHSLPPGQQFGHAGAIVGSLGESAAEKTAYMSSRGITMSYTLDELIKSL